MKPLHALFARTSVALGIAMGAAGMACAEEPPALGAFATGDGAYYTTMGSPVVDPYFINKSFIISMQASAPLQAEFAQWIQWLLPRQRKDGGFDRFCREADKTWRNCMAADADDSMAATTIQMLNMGLQKAWVPAPQRRAAVQAIAASQRLLASLRNPQSQLYRVFPGTELYYLMDNIEVYEALRSDIHAAGPANQLAAAIRKQFWTGQQWKPAIPEYAQVQFYPHTLASAYLWNTGILPIRESDNATAQWLAQHRDTWLARSGDHYAWGLVAWNMRQSAPLQAACWRASLRPFQEKTGWTVLDAMVDLSLAHLGIVKQCASALPAAAP